MHPQLHWRHLINFLFHFSFSRTYLKIMFSLIIYRSCRTFKSKSKFNPFEVERTWKDHIRGPPHPQAPSLVLPPRHQGPELSRTYVLKCEGEIRVLASEKNHGKKLMRIVSIYEHKWWRQMNTDYIKKMNKKDEYRL